MTQVVPRSPAALEVAGPLLSFTDQWLANRRLSPNTRAAYRRDVVQWLDWCTANSIQPLQAKFTHVNAWARHLEQPPAEGERAPSSATVARKLSSVASWYNFLVKVEAVVANPVAQADRPRVDRDHSSTIGFTPATRDKLLAAATQDNSLGPCSAVLADWMAVMGTRVSETIGVNIEDLGWDEIDTGERVRTVLLTVKGNHRQRRTVPAGLWHQVQRYLAARASEAGVEVDALTGPLFVARDGRSRSSTAGQAQYRRLTRYQVDRFCKRIGARAGMPNWLSLSPHSFRVAFVTTARKQGAALEDVQDAMGHRDPRTTRRYDRDRDSLNKDPSRLLDAGVQGRVGDPGE